MIDPAPWVHGAVKERFKELEQSNDLSYEDERDCARRLVTDPRMQEVYGSKYLGSRLTEQGWRLWFDIAKGDYTDDLVQARGALKSHAELIRDLDGHLGEVARIVMALDDLDAGEASMPSELYNPLRLLEAAADQVGGSDSEHLSSQFRQFVKPSLDELRRFDTGRYIPSVPQLLFALSNIVTEYAYTLEDTGAVSSYHDVGAALVSRQHAPVPEYVRLFDEAMGFYDWETGGSDFLVPSTAMALQVAVVFNLNSVDEKQIRSARGKTGARRKTDP